MLSTTQMIDFARDGYLVVPGVVDAGRCAAADARLSELLGDHTEPGPHSRFEPARREPLLMATLTESPAWACAQELVAPNPLEARPQVQAAWTLPPYPMRPGGGHIDGLTPPEPDGRPGSFTLLAGIVLSDQTTDDSGNLWVWPGSHRRLAEHLCRAGADAIKANGATPLVEPGEPVQVQAAPGDLILASYLLSHNLGGNVSTVVRRTLYYRLSVAGHREHWRTAVTDELAEFPAVRAAARPGNR